LAQSAELQKVGQEVLDLQKDLEDLRRPKDPMYQDVLKYVYPGLSNWTGEPGRAPERAQIWDDSAVRFNRLMGNGLMGFTMSPSIRWFSLGLFGKYGEPLKVLDIPGAASWLRSIEDAIYGIFSRSNFYSQAADMGALAGSFGSPVVWCDTPRVAGEDWSFQCLHPGHTWFSEDERKALTTYSRLVRMQGKSLAANFKKIEEEIPALWKEWKDSPRKWFKVFHVTHPNDEWAPGVRLDKKGKKFRSYYVTDGGDVLEDGGMDDSRFLGWRWQTTSDQVYGESVSMDAMASIKVLQQMKRTLTTAAQLAVEPPLMIPDHLRNKANLVPRGQNFYSRADQRIERVDLVGNYPITDAAYQNQVGYVADCYHANLWLMLDRQSAASRMTAYEVSQRMGEKAAALAPILARHQSEFADPLITMVYNVEMKAGRMPLPPPALRAYVGSRLVPIYTGPLAVAQRRNGVMDSLSMSLAALSPIASIRSEVFDHLSFDGWVRTVMETSGVPGEVVNDPEAVMQIRQARIQQSQAAQQQQAQLDFMKAYKGLTRAGEPGSPGKALAESFGITQPEQNMGML